MRKIGLLFADDAHCGLGHDFFANVIEGFRIGINDAGGTLTMINVSSNHNNRTSYMDQIRELGIDGIGIASIDFADPEVQEVLESGIPLVVIDEDIEGAICVKSDNENGIKDMVRYIYEMGHRKIAFISGNINTVTNIRIRAFLEACEELGIQVPDEYLANSYYRDMKEASYQTEKLLRLMNPPTCIIYSDDYAAIGGLNILRARGMDIPKDISIVGYDGLDFAKQYEPRLTTVKQDMQGMGNIAARKLMEKIDNPDTPVSTIVLETVVEKGRTVRRVYGA